MESDPFIFKGSNKFKLNFSNPIHEIEIERKGSNTLISRVDCPHPYIEVSDIDICPE